MVHISGTISTHVEPDLPADPAERRKHAKYATPLFSRTSIVPKMMKPTMVTSNATVMCRDLYSELSVGVSRRCSRCWRTVHGSNHCSA